ncbi:hypothetical protein B0H11DRAFT_2279706 [Mycena galericulata]|nr:hypothetical protein B0H11DRAFT_2279706 [Mycena galericulata]
MPTPSGNNSPALGDAVIAEAPPSYNLEELHLGVLPAFTYPDTHSDDGNNSDDTDDSVPDLVPATPPELHAVHNVHTLYATPDAALVVNGITNGVEAMQIGGNRARRDSIVRSRYHPSFNNHLQVQVNGAQTSNNWQAPAHLAHRAIRDAVADRLTNFGVVVNGPIANNVRRGGAPYQGRAVNGHMIYDLIQRLQRLERALQGLQDEAMHDWLPRRF